MPEAPSVDFLKSKYKLVPDRAAARKGRRVKRALVGGGFLMLLLAFGVSWQLAKATPTPSSQPEAFSIITSLKRLVGAESRTLVGEADDRVNFLLLGVGGAGHDGAELSDTIIFASLRPSTHEIAMLSIPRDLAVPTATRGYQKINAINAYAEMDNKGSGLTVTSKAVSDLLGQPVHYAVKADFNGFKDLIEAVGGVDVYVDRAFTDPTYPVDDGLGSVTVVSFESGWQHMDGDTALTYSRSRKGTNGEGSDFARAARQQKLLLAVKDKVLQPTTILNPIALGKLIETFQKNVKTDLSMWEMVKLAKYAPDIKPESIHVHVLDDSPDSPLYSTHINEAYVLLPKRDDWNSLKTIAENIFALPTADHLAASSVPTREPIRLEIQNGTNMPGLAFQTSQLLAGSGFEVVSLGNADSKDYRRTIIYDLTEGRKATELAQLKNYLEADVAMSPQGWMYADEVVPRELTVNVPGQDGLAAKGIDFLVILGEDAENLVLR